MPSSLFETLLDGMFHLPSRSNVLIEYILNLGVMGLELECREIVKNIMYYTYYYIFFAIEKNNLNYKNSLNSIINEYYVIYQHVFIFIVQSILILIQVICCKTNLLR